MYLCPWNDDVIICADLQDKFTENPSTYCSRSQLRSVVDEAAKNGITFGVGFELEFVMTETINGKQVPASRGSYCHTLDFVPPRTYKCLTSMVDALNEMGIEMCQFHSECSEGQFEFALNWSDPVQMCDDLQVCKECIINVATQHGFKSTKVDYDQKAKKYKNVDFDETAEGFIGEIQENLQAIMRQSCGSHNSLKRFVAGAFAGAYICWGVGNKEAPLRLIQTQISEGCNTIECKAFDSFGNPYLGLAGLLSVGQDGILKKTKLSRDKWVQGAPNAELSDTERKARGIQEFPTSYPEMEKYEFSGLAKRLMDNDGVTCALACQHQGWNYQEKNMPTIPEQIDYLRDKF